MQTSLAVRDTVMKLLDVILFVIIYVVTTLFLVANADPRLVVPLLIWLLLLYICAAILCAANEKYRHATGRCPLA